MENAFFVENTVIILIISSKIKETIIIDELKIIKIIKIMKNNMKSFRKFNKNNTSDKQVYSINKDNYQEDFSRDCFSDNAIEISNIENNNESNNSTNVINDNNFTIWILDSSVSISTTNNISLFININKCNVKFYSQMEEKFYQTIMMIL